MQGEWQKRLPLRGQTIFDAQGRRKPPCLIRNNTAGLVCGVHGGWK